MVSFKGIGSSKVTKCFEISPSQQPTGILRGPALIVDDVGFGRQSMRISPVIIARYPLHLRIIASGSCTLFLILVLARSPIHVISIFSSIVFLGLTIALIAYRAEISEKEIAVRYLPFFTKRTLVRDVTDIVERQTIILVTATSQIPIWGLNSKTKEELVRILARHLSYYPTESEEEPNIIDVKEKLRKHVRRTAILGGSFLVTALSNLPFLQGNLRRSPWLVVEKFLFALSLILLLTTIMEGFSALNFWSLKRQLQKIDREP